MAATKRIRFIVQPRQSASIWPVYGKDIEDAANIYARRLRRSAVALRTTGHAGLSGYFQAYVSPSRGPGLTTFGEPFHVTRG